MVHTRHKNSEPGAGAPQLRKSTRRQTKAPVLELALRVTLEVDLYTLRHEALTAFLATATDEVTASFGLHAGAESVLLLAGSLGWLVSAFHWPV